MNRIYVLVILIISCTISKPLFRSQEDYTARFIGEDHSLRKYGIRSSRGIYITKNNDLDVRIKLLSYKFSIFRKGKLLKKWNIKGNYYPGNLYLYLDQELIFRDSIVIDNILAKESGEKFYVTPINIVQLFVN
ncbi:MAG: hypothetical protein WBP33_17015 [Saprospiraceae bacterium]|nr:hypothetical protein [Candidatus Vicinibacter proximus]